MDEKQNSLAMLPLLLAFLVSGSLGTFTAAAFPELQQEFSISTSLGSLLYVAWGIGVVTGSLIANRVITRYNPSRILVFSAIIGMMATHMGGDTQNYVVFMSSYALLGVTSGVILTTGHGYVGRSSNERSSSNISALDFALSLGTVSAPMLIEYFAIESTGLSGWRDVFSLYEMILLAFGGIVMFVDFGAPLPSAPSSRASGSAVIRFLRNPVFVWFSITSFLYHAFEYGHTYWFVTYSLSLPDIDVEEARNIFIGFLSGAIVSRMVLSWIATNRVMKYILPISAATALALIYFMPTYTSYSSLYLVNIIFGAAVGVIFPSMLAVAVSTSDRLGGVFSSSALIAGALGAQISALLLGAVIDQGYSQKIYTILTVVGFALLVSTNSLIRHCAIFNFNDSKSQVEGTL